MSVSLTHFGAFAIPLIIGAILFRRDWLLAALVIASTMQAPAILNFEFGQGPTRYGFTAFSFLAVAIALSIIPQLSLPRFQRDWLKDRAGLNLKLWLTYASVAIVGAAVLPVIFRDTPVFLLIERNSFESGVSPLRLTLSNLAQSCNLVLFLSIMVYIRLHHADKHLVKRMIIGLAVALGLSALTGLLQRFAWLQSLPTMVDFWTSNAAYAHNYVSYAGPVARVSWPFTEPSYGSAWYASMFGGCMTVFFVGKRTQLALHGMLVAGFALLNSLGATGVMAIGAFGVIGAMLWGYYYATHPPLRWKLGYQLILAALVGSCCTLGTYVILRHFSLLANAQSAVTNLLTGGNLTFWGDIRPETNRLALSVIGDSYGLGVGLGSNRASSYFASLFSNTGILGGLIFLAALTHLGFSLLRIQKSLGSQDVALFLFGSLCTATIAVGIAIPDQNWPNYWIFILISYAWISQFETSQKPVAVEMLSRS